MPVKRPSQRRSVGIRWKSFIPSGAFGCQVSARPGLMTCFCIISWKCCVTRVGHSRRDWTRAKCYGEGAGTKRLGKDVSGCHRILDRNIDADATDRRQGMSGIADAQQSRSIPSPKAIDLGGQELDVVPALERVRAIAEPWQQLLQNAPEIVDAIVH